MAVALVNITDIKVSMLTSMEADSKVIIMAMVRVIIEEVQGFHPEEVIKEAVEVDIIQDKHQATVEALSAEVLRKVLIAGKIVTLVQAIKMMTCILTMITMKAIKMIHIWKILM